MDIKTAGKRSVKSVLIIADEADIRSFFVRVLELEGYSVLEASDSSAGMKIMKENEVALVLLDLKLPCLDGWTILREIKRDPAFTAIPVVVISAIAEAAQRRRTLRLGAASYLVKPLSAHSLSQEVAAAIGRHSPPRKTPAAVRPQPDNTSQQDLEKPTPSPIAI